MADAQPAGFSECHLHSLSIRSDQHGKVVVELTKDCGTISLKGILGSLKHLTANDCDVSIPDDDTLQLRWSNETQLTISHVLDDKTHCYTLTWKSAGLDSKKTFRDVYDSSNGHWYGATAIQSQLWPIEKWQRDVTAYVTGDSFADEYGGVQERYWLSSNGVAIFVDQDVPLFVGMDSKEFAFVSKFEHPYSKPSNSSALFLTYKLVHSDNVRSAHQYVAGRLFPTPSDIPDERMFTHPIWSTWAMYKKNINESVVLEYANKIAEHGFSNSQLEIDDKWTPGYGDWDFDRRKFPDPKRLIDTLKSKGFRTTVWVHPFATPFSRSYWGGVTRRRWMTMPAVRLPAIGTWWNGLGASLDVTNEQAVQWFLERLKFLQDTYGVSSFKFDAGETNWLPHLFTSSKPMPNPNTYTTLYAELAFKADSTIRHQEIRGAVNCQQLPVFVRMMDKDSNWGYKNGLKTLIPHVLTFGLIGYPFVLPDMIGGNAYSGYITGTVYPDRELFIRWLEATVFMPSLQFSVTPWLYDDDVIAISKKMVELHEKYSPVIIELAKECVHSGSPINRPLWWADPEDETCQTIDSEFLLGNDILVAPILEQGALSRDIYLPLGKWRDELRNGVCLDGGKWYYAYKVELDELAFFTRLESSAQD